LFRRTGRQHVTYVREAPNQFLGRHGDIADGGYSAGGQRCLDLRSLALKRDKGHADGREVLVARLPNVHEARDLPAGCGEASLVCRCRVLRRSLRAQEVDQSMTEFWGIQHLIEPLLDPLGDSIVEVVCRYPGGGAKPGATGDVASYYPDKARRHLEGLG